jgi:hypothetical protein
MKHWNDPSSCRHRLAPAASSSEPPYERRVGVPSSRSLATATREATSFYESRLGTGTFSSAVDSRPLAGPERPHRVGFRLQRDLRRAGRPLRHPLPAGEHRRHLHDHGGQAGGAASSYSLPIAKTPCPQSGGILMAAPRVSSTGRPCCSRNLRCESAPCGLWTKHRSSASGFAVTHRSDSRGAWIARTASQRRPSRRTSALMVSDCRTRR